MEREIHPLVKQMIPVVAPLAEAISPWAEIVLHDFANLNRSVVAISGDITNRKIGAPITNLILESLKANKVDNIINYQNELPDGRLLRSSTIFIKDNGKPVGCLCINIDVTVPFSYLNQLTATVSFKEIEDPPQKTEKFPNEIVEMTKEMIETTIREYTKPVAMMLKNDKLQIVKQLDALGLFLVKGAVEEISKTLHVTKYTIYNYLDEIRSDKLFSENEDT